jgi:hypothetical protein
MVSAVKALNKALTPTSVAFEKHRQGKFVNQEEEEEG